ncbi:hypothetical protein LTR64_000250 [Lithohypha guttulata]|uniref:uncharacterized protein n=1 Tax=Lithohypha guttulata TaxID=1690604 RepID=UPI002DDDC99B|nr:hypothetical protein LTR51_007612 [Lithohypha guttulata]
MPKAKQKWVPARSVDPNFIIPSKTSKALVIKDGLGNAQRYPLAFSDNIRGDLLPKSVNTHILSKGTTKQAEQPNTIDNNHLLGFVNPNLEISGTFPTLTEAKGIQNASQSTVAISGVKPVPESIQMLSNGQEAESLKDLMRNTASVTINDEPSAKPIPPPGHRSRLDIYAHKYVPYWLKAINESFATTVHAPQIRRIDFDIYHSSFAGTRFQRHLPAVELPPPSSILGLQVNAISIETYGTYWHERLTNEASAQAAQNDTFALFNIDLVLVNAADNLYRFKMPGLREGAPRIDLGDILWIRPFILPRMATIAQEAQLWSQERNGIAPAFIGIEHHAVVWSLIRRDEFVLVRIGKELPRGTKCNIVIPLQIHKNAPAWRAVQQIGFHIVDENQPWTSSMLFPTFGVQQKTLAKGAFDLDWYDEQLNFEQQRAVQAVVDAKYGILPYLISGPPGTGKTKTMVEIALQLISASNKIKPHLLVCAPSDAAADTLLVRLSAQLSQAQLFRLNNWTRLTSEVPGEVRPYCCLDENQLHALPDFETMMSFEVVVTTCRDANMLITAGLTNKDLAHLVTRTVLAICPDAIDTSKLLHWTALIIDEAAQATEPEVLIPVAVVAPLHTDSKSSNSSFSPQIVMAGDEHQLGPRLTSTALAESAGKYDTAGLEISLFQRIFARPLYADHPLSRSYGLRPLTRNMLPMIRPPFANLIRNYRSHPAILTTSSALFYSDTLIPERPETSPIMLSWPRWPKKSKNVWPVMFYSHSGPDNVESILEGDGTGSGSLLNHSEARITVELVLDLLDHINNKDTPTNRGDYLKAEDIIVLSPFRAQVNLLRQMFRSSGYYDIRIGPLEAFQGLESRVVVVCTTRTRLGQHPHPPAKFVNEDKSRNLGMIDEPKRFNVAMTRAQEALIVIGNAEVLSVTRDRCWLSFLRFCTRNNLCAGGKAEWFGKNTSRERVDTSMGRLERAMRYAESLQGETNGERHDVHSLADTDTLDDNIQPDSFKFKLQGTMIDLDQQMWEMQIGEEDEEIIRQEEEADDDRYVFNGHFDGPDLDGDDSEEGTRSGTHVE